MEEKFKIAFNRQSVPCKENNVFSIKTCYI